MTHTGRHWYSKAIAGGAALLGIALGIPNAALAAGATITAPAVVLGNSAFIVGGAGWKASESVRVTLVQGATSFSACSLFTTASGSLGKQACFTPSTVKAGTYKVQATDGTTTVNAAASTKVAPAIQLFNPTSQQPVFTAGASNSVEILGWGFGSNIKTVKLGTTAVTPSSTSVQSGGQYGPATFTVPPTTPAGTYALTVTDNGSNVGTAKIKIFRASFSGPTSAASGGPFAFSGGGWPPNDRISVTLSSKSATASVCAVISDSGGAIAAQECPTPVSLPARTYTVVATDGSDAVTAPETAFSFKMLPALTLFSGTQTSSVVNTVGAGNAIDVEGTGFGQSGSVQKVTFDSTAVKFTPVKLTASGSFSTELSFTVPATATAANHTITVTDNASTHDAATAGVQVYKPTLSAVSSGFAGGFVNVSGTGWPAGDRLTLNLITGPETAPTFSQGVFCNVALQATGGGVLPKTACPLPTNIHAGAFSLELTDASDAVIAPLVAFTMNPSLTLNSGDNDTVASNVAAGSLLDVNGAGFGSNMKTAVIGTTSVSLSTLIVTNGEYAGQLTVPATLPAGTYTVKLTDTGSHSASAVITVYKPTISLGEAKGNPSDPVVPTGAGWPVNDRMSVFVLTGNPYSPTTQFFVCSVQTDSTGSIIPVGCAVPASAPAGSYTLFAGDGSYDVYATSSFTVG